MYNKQYMITLLLERRKVFEIPAIGTLRLLASIFIIVSTSPLKDLASQFKPESSHFSSSDSP